MRVGPRDRVEQVMRSARAGMCSALLAMMLTLCASGVVRADSFTEDFASVPLLTGAGWVLENLSSPLGETNWFQGNIDAFPAHLGSPNSYIAANFENAGSSVGATISNWLISPELEFNDGDVISFWTRSLTKSDNTQFADRLQLRLSTSGASTEVGGTATSIGVFTQILLDINENYNVPPCDVPAGVCYPSAWQQYSVTLGGLGGPTLGRFALRYFVENGGPDGDRSNYIGIDTLEYIAIPEPASLALLALPLLLLRRRPMR